MGHAKQKMSSGICRQQMPSSACVATESDQGLSDYSEN